MGLCLFVREKKNLPSDTNDKGELSFWLTVEITSASCLSAQLDCRSFNRAVFLDVLLGSLESNLSLSNSMLLCLSCLGNGNVSRQSNSFPLLKDRLWNRCRFTLFSKHYIRKLEMISLIQTKRTDIPRSSGSLKINKRSQKEDCDE